MMKKYYFIAAIYLLIAAVTFAESPVKTWQEQIVLPAYKLRPADLNPMFYTEQSYQGAQKRVYPYPLLDGITDKREEKTFKVLYLENDYVRLSILPEMGGRLFSATDKTNGYDFFYRQHVIKPALVGMLGAWISGGIEWCVFHHHRNTTYMPIDYTLEENPDGSKTIWIGETEYRHRMRWIIGITLYPDKSYIEVTVKMFNRSALPHSILYWANVAAHANDDYQVIFPPSVQVATYHAKNAFTHWPISKGTYRGVDYEGVDLSWWKNHPRSNSFFAWELKEDFMGGYDHGKQAGVIHTANHNIVCGAKLWEWGPGSIWDTKILTDTDGPYAELMVGAFSDNQPDYSWIKPYEVKTFKQYWYPVREIGGFKNANLDAAVNLEIDDDVADIGFNATSQLTDAMVILALGDKIILEEIVDIGPDIPYTKQIQVPAGTIETDLKATLKAADGRILIEYQPIKREQVAKLPQVVKVPPAPQNIETIEELYLTGLRVEQIHNPSIDPFDYYEEALRRDPQDSRTNTIVAVNYNKRQMYELAEKHLRKAIKRISSEYTRPGDTEAYYHLGLALKGQGRLSEAYETFYKATWDYAFHSAAYFQLATLSARKTDFIQALEQIERSLNTNSINNKALNLKAAILRKLGRDSEAEKITRDVLLADPLNFPAMNELYLLQRIGGNDKNAKKILDDMTAKMRGEVQTYLELAADYMDYGFYKEAIDVLLRPVKMKIPFAGGFPMVHYYLGYLYEQTQMPDKAKKYLQLASQMPTDYCFPFRHESIAVLNRAIRNNPSDSRASYYLGNLLYDIQPERAIEHWERAAALDPKFALVYRNLGWGYYRQKDDSKKAIESYEKAISLNNTDPTYYIELDKLYNRANTPISKRLKLLEDNNELVTSYKPLLVRKISLLVKMNQYDEAIDLLGNNRFYTSEGGGQLLHTAHVDSRLLRGLRYMKHKQYSKALQDFLTAKEYPENLSLLIPRQEKRSAQIFYHIASAYAALKDRGSAEKFYNKTINLDVPDRWPDARFYQAMALRELGQNEKASMIFDELVANATENLSGGEKIDFFAKFGGQESLQAQKAATHYALGLGLLGRGQIQPIK